MKYFEHNLFNLVKETRATNKSKAKYPFMWTWMKKVKTCYGIENIWKLELCLGSTLEKLKKYCKLIFFKLLLYIAEHF